MPNSFVRRNRFFKKDSNERPKVVANRILGCGIIFFGIVLIATGLIIGIEFPSHVRDNTIDFQCILNKDHPQFLKWKNDEFDVKINRVSFWHLNNSDDYLFRGHYPQLVEMGPYIYKEKHYRISVNFTQYTVSYKTMITQQFMPEETAKECGSSCNELDKITVLNSKYLEMVSSYGNAENYILSKVPITLLFVLNNISNECCGGDITKVYKQFSFISNMNATVLNISAQLANISFGNFVFESKYRNEILNYRKNSVFNETEIRGLYGCLTNSSCLGVTANHFIQQINSRTEPDLLKSCYHSDSLSGGKTALPPCGLLQYTRHYFDTNRVLSPQTIRTHINHILCPSPTSCFNIPNDTDMIKWYIHVVFYFISGRLLPLVNFVMSAYELNNIVETLSPKYMTKGYSRSGYYGNTQNGKIPNIKINGILNHHSSVDEAIKFSDTMTLKTCMYDRKVENNMVVLNVVSKSHKDIYSRVTNGRTDYTLMGIKNHRTCWSDILNKSNMFFYVPQLLRSFRFGDVQETSVFDTTIERYHLNLGTEGLYDTTELTGYRSGIKAASFLPSSNGYDYNSHSSYVDVEPITGRVWQKRIRLQHYKTLVDSDLRVNGLQHLLIAHTNRSLPSYWVDHHQYVSQDIIDRHYQKVVRLLRASCGGLIGMGIISFITISVGLVITLIPIRVLGRVAPMPDHEAPVSIS